MNLNCFSLNAVFIFLIIFLGSDQHHLSAETTTAEKAMVVNFGFGYCQRISFIRFDLMNVSEPGGGSATPLRDRDDNRPRWVNNTWREGEKTGGVENRPLQK